MLFHTLLLAALSTWSIPDAPPPPPAPVTCSVEVRMEEVADDGQSIGLDHDRLINRGSFPVTLEGGQYETGQRAPVITYTFDHAKWNAQTSFQSTGVKVTLKRLPGHENLLHYKCEVSAVVAVVPGSLTPVIGTVRWDGNTTLTPDQPLVLTSTYRVPRCALILPRNHPLSDPKVKPPEKDLVQRITFVVKIQGQTKKRI
jgi:hypothetical protein